MPILRRNDCPGRIIPIGLDGTTVKPKEDCGDGPFVSVPLFMPVDKQGDRYKRTVPFFPKKDRPFFSLFFQESDKALFLETGICKKSNKASILFQAISFTLIPSTAREIII